MICSTEMKRKIHFKNNLFKKQKKTFTQLDLYYRNSKKEIKLKLYIEFLFPSIKTKDPPKSFKTYRNCACDNFIPTMYFLFS